MSEFKNRSVSNTVKSRVEQSSIAVCTGDNELYEKFLKNSDNSNIAGYSSNTFSDVDFTKNTDSKVLNVPDKPLNIINFDCSPVIEESTYSGENANPTQDTLFLPVLLFILKEMIEDLTDGLK